MFGSLFCKNSKGNVLINFCAQKNPRQKVKLSFLYECKKRNSLSGRYVLLSRKINYTFQLDEEKLHNFFAAKPEKFSGVP
jgi:hypothetical protein